jgi:DNA-binding transcriptional ArsR family regulator
LTVINPPRRAVDLARLQKASRRATSVLQALANENRLLLLCEISRAESCVADLEARLAIRQPTLSQQLGILREEGLVATRREGRRIYYRVADAAVLAILDTLYDQFCAPRARKSA